MSKTKTPPDPDLTMSEAEVNAILSDAQAEAEQAARTLQEAEATARGEAPSAGLAMKAAEVTPGRLVELRAAVDLATLRVQAAETRTQEVREKQLLAYQAELAENIRMEAAADLDTAEDIIAALDTFEDALKGLCGVLESHNERVAHWTKQMATAQVPRGDSADSGPLGKTYRLLADGILVDGKAFRSLPAGKIVLTTLRRVMADDAMVTHIAPRWVEQPGGPVDVRARIRRDA